MKFNGKHIAITAGLGAVLALSPVVGPMATAFAQSNNGAAATQAQAHSVKVIIDGANYGNWGMPDNAGYVSDLAKDNVPEGYEFLGTWSVVWQNGSATAGKSLDELAENWGSVTSITAEYRAVEQGGDEGEPEEPAEQINVTFQYGNTSVATVADENGNIDAAGLDLPENYTWSWTDSQGTVHEFGSDKLAGYIFTESCTVTGVPAEDPSSPLIPSYPVNEYITVHLVDTDGTPIRDVVVQNGTSNWSGAPTNPEKDGYVFVGWQQEGASISYPFWKSLVIAADEGTTELTFKAIWDEATPEQREIKVNYYDGDELLVPARLQRHLPVERDRQPAEGRLHLPRLEVRGRRRGLHRRPARQPGLRRRRERDRGQPLRSVGGEPARAAPDQGQLLRRRRAPGTGSSSTAPPSGAGSPARRG